MDQRSGLMAPEESFPPAGRRLRLGVVGGGQGAFIGEVHAGGARLSNRWELVAGALSSDPEKAAASGRAWHLDPERSYADFRAMARAEGRREDGIEAVAITVPNALHAEVATAFMEEGIDVISDKPLTATLAEAEELAGVYRRTGVVYGVTYAYSAHVMARQAREMVRAGLLGDLRQVHVEFLQDWAMNLTDATDPVPWRLDPTRSGPSFTVGDIGTHAEHLARFVTGLAPEEVRADLHCAGAPKQLEDTAFVQVRWSGGVPGTLLVSQAFAGAQGGLRIRLSGSEAGLEWCQEEPEFLHFRPMGEPSRTLQRGEGAGMLPEAMRRLRVPRGHPEAFSDAWANLYREMAIAIEARRGGVRLPEGVLDFPTFEDGLAGMRFVDAVLRSQEEGGWVRVRAGSRESTGEAQP